MQARVSPRRTSPRLTRAPSRYAYSTAKRVQGAVTCLSQRLTLGPGSGLLSPAHPCRRSCAASTQPVLQTQGPCCAVLSQTINVANDPLCVLQPPALQAQLYQQMEGPPPVQQPPVPQRPPASLLEPPAPLLPVLARLLLTAYLSIAVSTSRKPRRTTQRRNSMPPRRYVEICQEPSNPLTICRRTRCKRRCRCCVLDRRRRIVRRFRSRLFWCR